MVSEQSLPAILNAGDTLVLNGCHFWIAQHPHFRPQPQLPSFRRSLADRRLSTFTN